MRAILWFFKGFWMAIAQFWSCNRSTRQDGVTFVLFLRTWVMFCLDMSLTVRNGPWTLQVRSMMTSSQRADSRQVVPCTSIVLSLALILPSLRRMRQTEPERIDSEAISFGEEL
jgi:hypothetical protein